MTNKVFLKETEIKELAATAAKDIKTPLPSRFVPVYAIPRGGVSAAYLINIALLRDRGFDFRYVDHPSKADYIIDDMIDSGATMGRVLAEAINGNNDPAKSTPKPIVLIDKTKPTRYKDAWIVFPWEKQGRAGEEGIEDNIRRILQSVGEDPDRGGLLETPSRVSKAWEFWTSGYSKDPSTILKVFEDGAEDCDEMVIVRDIPFYTHCEHHMAPFFGTATIAYLPEGKIVGLSKLNRVLDMYARRLQVQERLTSQVADALMGHLKPLGCGVVVTARHLCMESRGVCQQGHRTTTSALRGLFKEDPAVRSEFLSLAR